VRRADPSPAKRAALAGAALVLLLAGCGWHLVGRGAGALDPRIKVIAVPSFGNDTKKEEVDVRLTEAVTNELLRRGRFTVVPDKAGADAVLEGVVKGFDTANVAFDDSGKVTRAEVRITAGFVFRNLVADRVEWENPSFVFRQEYDVVGDPKTYTDQEIVAIQDVSRDFALSVVSQILEGF